jgi:hypothetical protein
VINPISGYQTTVDLNQGPVTPVKTHVATPVSTSANQDSVTLNGSSQSSVQLPVYQAGKTDSPLGNGLSNEPKSTQLGGDVDHDGDTH